MKKFFTLFAVATAMTAANAASVLVDDASKVRLVNESYEQVTLANGVTEIANGNYMLNPIANYQLNSVKLNGEEVAAPFGYYALELNDSSNLVITALYEQPTYAVVFNDLEAIKSIVCLDENLETAEVEAAELEIAEMETAYAAGAPAGYKVVVTLNEGYTATLNGVATASPIYFFATKTNVIITAEQELAVVNIDNADMVKIQSENGAINVVNGSQKLSAGYYMISSTQDYMLASVELNGKAINHLPGATYWMVELAANDTLDITANYEDEVFAVIFNDVEAIDSVVCMGQTLPIAEAEEVYFTAAPAGYKVIVNVKAGYTVTLNGADVTSPVSFYATDNNEIVTTAIAVPTLAEGLVAINAADSLVGSKVVLMNKANGLYLYGKDAQNVAMGTYEEATAETNAVVNFVIELDANGNYMFRAITPAGADYALWGSNPTYLNSQPAVGGVSFILGKDQDTENGSSWYLNWSDALQAWGIVNVANNGNLAGTAIVAEENFWVIGAKAEDIVSISNIAAVATEQIFDIAGNKVEKMTRGLYIVNGKKVSVK